MTSPSTIETPSTTDIDNDEEKIHIIHPKDRETKQNLQLGVTPVLTLCGKTVPFQGLWKQEFARTCCQECWVRKSSYYPSDWYPG